jgi:hypothetical protein
LKEKKEKWDKRAKREGVDREEKEKQKIKTIIKPMLSA